MRPPVPAVETCDAASYHFPYGHTSNGVTATQTDDFVVTKAVWKHDHLVATAMQDAQRTPSAIVTGDIFLIRSWTRLPSHDHE